MKESYNDLTSLHRHNPYLKSEVSGKIRKTNFHSEDCYKENDYLSTATRSFLPTSVPGKLNLLFVPFVSSTL